MMSQSIFNSTSNRINAPYSNFLCIPKDHLKVHLVATGLILVTFSLGLGMGLAGVGTIPTVLTSLLLGSAILITDCCICRVISNRMIGISNVNPNLIANFADQASEQKLKIVGDDSFTAQSKSFWTQAVTQHPKIINEMNEVFFWFEELDANQIRFENTDDKLFRLNRILYMVSVFEKSLNSPIRSSEKTQYDFTKCNETSADPQLLEDQLQSKLEQVIMPMFEFIKHLREMKRSTDPNSDLGKELDTFFNPRVHRIERALDALKDALEKEGIKPKSKD